MTSLSRSYPSQVLIHTGQTDLSNLTSYTVNKSDSQLYYNNSSTIQITLPTQHTAKWGNYPIIYITNMSPSNGILMTFNLASGVKVKAPDQTNYVSHFSVRGGFNAYIIYTGNNQWMLQGVGANFDGA
jgi:hypothetical protein